MARLLVVEDFRPLAAAIAVVLRREGHEVVQCHLAEEVLSNNDVYDHSILDVDLPDGNGVRLAQELMTTRRTKSVVFFTASREREVLATASCVGLVVNKSAGCERLVAAVRQLQQPGQYRLAAIAGSSAGDGAGATNGSGTRRRVE